MRLGRTDDLRRAAGNVSVDRHERATTDWDSSAKTLAGSVSWYSILGKGRERGRERRQKSFHDEKESKSMRHGFCCHMALKNLMSPGPRFDMPEEPCE